MALNVSHEEFRTMVLEAVKIIGAPGSQQMSSIRDVVASIAAARGMLPAGNPRLVDQDYGQVMDIAWDLIIEGIIRPGLKDGQNNTWPFYHVTAYGQKKIEDAQSAYDPDGYLKRLTRDVPDLDSVILTYLNESLHTFRIGCLLSSTITLGCAAEKALLLLIDAYRNSLPASSKEKFKGNTEGRMIKRQFEEFQKMIDSELKARLPGNLKDGLDIELTALFEFIRVQRNDAGHPTGIVIERERAYANLVVFPVYAKRVYALIGWLATNPKK